MQPGNDGNAFGIDTNQFQGTENWNQIARAAIHGVLPVRFALIRASQGLTADRAVATAAAGATAAGLWRGFFHTIIPQGTTPQARQQSAGAQATFFVKTVQGLGGWTGRCLNPGVDIEINPFGLSPADYCDWLERFLAALMPHVPFPPMLYLSPHAWTTLLGRSTAFRTFPLWVADWGVGQPTDFGGWTEWLCWQWSAPGPLAGVPHVTDYDEWHTSQLPDPIPIPTAPAGGPSSPAGSPAASPSGGVPTTRPTLVTQMADTLRQLADELTQWAQGGA